MFGMGTGMASPLESPGFRASGRVRQRRRGASAWCDSRAGRRSDLRFRSRVMDRHDSQPLTPGQLLKRSSPRPLVPLSFIRHRTSTCGLSNRWSPCGLTRLTRWGTSSPGELRTEMLSALIPAEHSYPAVPLAGQLAHQRFVHSGPLVLGAAPVKFPTPTADRDRTVSRRSEPSSRAALIGEQPNPWDVLPPQDATSRHRGAKRCRRCELLGTISLLSPG